MAEEIPQAEEQKKDKPPYLFCGCVGLFIFFMFGAYTLFAGDQKLGGDGESLRNTLYGPGSTNLGYPTNSSGQNPDSKEAKDCLKEYVKAVAPTSPFIEKNGILVDKIVASGNKYNINPALMMAIAQQETNFATIGMRESSYNYFNVKKNNTEWRSFSSYNEAIDFQGEYLKKEYFDKNLDTIEKIGGKYCPKSDLSCSTWVTNVTNIMNAISGKCPQYNTNTIYAGKCALPINPSIIQSIDDRTHAPAGTSTGHSAILSGNNGKGASDLFIKDRHNETVVLSTPVYAPFDGIITTSTNYDALHGQFGGYIIITSSDNQMVALLAHITGYPAKNTEVKAGQQLGTLAYWTNGSGAHLHFELKISGKFVDTWEVQKKALQTCKNDNLGITTGGCANTIGNYCPTSPGASISGMSWVKIKIWDGTNKECYVQIKSNLTNKIQKIFESLAEKKFPIHDVVGYGTRPSNYGYSYHTDGLAIDINRAENPFYSNNIFSGSKSCKVGSKTALVLEEEPAYDPTKAYDSNGSILADRKQYIINSTVLKIFDDNGFKHPYLDSDVQHFQLK